MMQTPSEVKLNYLSHFIPGYNPQKAHEYYLRTRHLKGREKGQQPPPASKQPHTAKPQKNKAQQKAELQANVTNLELKLHNLEALIAKKEATLAKDQQTAKSKAKQNHSGKNKGPKTAAQKAEAARKNKQYQQTHRNQIKNKQAQAKAKGKSGGGGGHKKGAAGKKDSQKSIAELKTLATKVKGLLAVAKQKLAAL
jgi:Tfp pilus assembly protein FimV